MGPCQIRQRISCRDLILTRSCLQLNLRSQAALASNDTSAQLQHCISVWPALFQLGACVHDSCARRFFLAILLYMHRGYEALRSKPCEIASGVQCCHMMNVCFADCASERWHSLLLDCTWLREPYVGLPATCADCRLSLRADTAMR